MIMRNLKIHINVLAGLNGITIQRCDKSGSYVVTQWNELTSKEQERTLELLQTLTIVLSNSTNGEEVVKKRCSRCNRVLPLNMFYKRMSAKGINMGMSICKECTIEAANKRNKAIRQKRTADDIKKDKEYHQKYYKQKKAAVEDTEFKVEQKDKQCKDCVLYKNCFTEEYKNESNFANSCKKYKHKSEE